MFQIVSASSLYSVILCAVFGVFLAARQRCHCVAVELFTTACRAIPQLQICGHNYSVAVWPRWSARGFPLCLCTLSLISSSSAPVTSLFGCCVLQGEFVTLCLQRYLDLVMHNHPIMSLLMDLDPPDHWVIGPDSGLGSTAGGFANFFSAFHFSFFLSASLFVSFKFHASQIDHIRVQIDHIRVSVLLMFRKARVGLESLAA